MRKASPRCRASASCSRRSRTATGSVRGRGRRGRRGLEERLAAVRRSAARGDGRERRRLGGGRRQLVGWHPELVRRSDRPLGWRGAPARLHRVRSRHLPAGRDRAPEGASPASCRSTARRACRRSAASRYTWRTARAAPCTTSALLSRSSAASTSTWRSMPARPPATTTSPPSSASRPSGRSSPWRRCARSASRSPRRARPSTCASARRPSSPSRRATCSARP